MTLIRIAKYRWKMMFQGPLDYVVFLIVPALVMYALSQVMLQATQWKDIPIMVVDQDQSSFSKAIVERVANNSAVDLELSDEQTAVEKVSRQEAEVAFILRDGLEQRLIDGDIAGVVEVILAPTSLSAGLVGEAVASEVIRFSANSRAAEQVNTLLDRHDLSLGDREQVWQDAWEYTDAQWEPEPLMTLDYRELGLGEGTGEQPNDQAGIQTGNQSENQAGVHTESEEIIRFFGILTILMMFLMIFSSGWLVTEKQQGVLQRVKSTPVSLTGYIVGNGLATYAMVFVLVSVVLGLSMMFMLTSLAITLEVVVLLALYLLVCLVLGLFLGTLLQSNGQYQMVAIFVVLATGLFGGSLLPLADITQRLHWLQFWTPQGWVLSGLRDHLQGQGFVDISLSLAMLLLFAFLFFCLTHYMLKQKEGSV